MTLFLSNISNSALWNWSSPVWLTVLALAGAYGWTMRRSEARISSALWFAAAMLVLLFAFVSPIGVLASGYLFSAHMVQHLLLLLVVPLFVLLSLPWGRAALPVPSRGDGPCLSHEQRGLRHRLAACTYGLLSVPMFGWICGLGAMWFWHVPSLCAAATESYALGIVRSTTFLLAGLAFWWPIYAPIHRLRLRPPAAVVYLFSACLGCTLLGIYITFTTITVCPAFANPADRIGILTMLYNAGYTPAADQHLGGLLMWVPPCSLYICAIISIMCRWYTEEESSGKQPVHVDASRQTTPAGLRMPSPHSAP